MNEASILPPSDRLGARNANRPPERENDEMTAYARPSDLHEALGILSDRPHRILAGGTDVYPADAAAVGWGRPGLDHPDSAPVLDITGVGTLGGIRRFPDRVELGALVTWTETLEADLPAWFDCVRLAAREVGGRQIQNRGTVAGNLCNASPAADGVPALLVLDTRVRLEHRGGAREVPLHEFITGNRRTCLQPGELMTAIVIPCPAPAARSTFLKLGARRYLVISIAMVAACLDVEDGRIRDARLAVGACSEVAQRLGGPGSAARGRARGRGARHGTRRGLRLSRSPRRRTRIGAVPPSWRACPDAPGPRRVRARGRPGGRRAMTGPARLYGCPPPPRLSWIPAFAGMTAGGVPGCDAQTVVPAHRSRRDRLPGKDDSSLYVVIPAQAGIHTASPEYHRALAGSASNSPAPQQRQDH